MYLGSICFVVLVGFIVTCSGQLTTRRADGYLKSDTQADCCVASEAEYAQGWKPACTRVRYYYKLIRCSWYYYCYRRFSETTYYCCEGQTLKDKICILPITTTTTITPQPSDSIAPDSNTTSTQSPAPKCGLSKYPDAGQLSSGLKQIVGGVTSRPNEFPWQVSIRKGSASGTYHFCGGSIISERLVVTAAHCAAYLSSVPGYPQYVVVGDHDRRTIPTNGVYVIKEFVIHPQYQSSSVKNDIAVLILASDIKFNADVQPICLPRKKMDGYDGKPAVVSGWGVTESGGSPSTLLMYAGLSVMSRAQCHGISVFRTLPDSMLCASDNSGYTEKDSCQGDSGGPLAYKNPDESDSFELIGIVSWGYGCAAGYPGIYTRVTEYVDWLDDVIQTHG